METEKSTENVWKAEQKNKENVENQAYQIGQERALEMLEELLEQDQFELLLPEYKLVYLMNDAVESFLVFHGARMTGIYQEDYEGPLDASVNYENGEYVLVVHQDDSVVTLFYQSLTLEVHLYNYGKIGHFWVEGYEYLRQLEYRIAILRDKLEYLGPEFCTPTEQKLAQLEQFPPLNYCCYPAVPGKYIVPKDNPWQPTEEAITVMEELAEEAGDKSMLRLLKYYRKHHGMRMTRYIAGKLHQTKHAHLIDLLTEKLKKETASYPDRSFGTEADERYQKLINQAKAEQEKLWQQGIKSEVLREEPFVTAQDELDYKVYLMIYKTRDKNRSVDVRTFKE